MSPVKAVCASFLLIGAFASGSATAHGVRFGFHFGIPLFAPWYYPPPAYYYPPPAYYYPPPVVTAPAAPPVYVERGEAPSAPPPEHWWYYCADTQAYYPYVKECPTQWQRVSPTPPGT